MIPQGPNGTVPMPPPAAHTLMSLQSRNNSNSATIPGGATTGELINGTAASTTSIINLSNSSDVVIGPMTQYQGPVTIYQYMDATVEARGVPSGGLGINANRRNHNDDANTSSESWNLKKSPMKVLLIAGIISIIGISVGVYFAVKQNNVNSEKSKDILFGNGYDDDTLPNLGNGHLIIDRKQWGDSQLSKLTNKLTHPIPYVMITHIGVQSTPCKNVYKCSIKMRTIQDSAIAEKSLPDLPANFYVGNDGYIYVGRGWDYMNSYANNSLAVCFMGDYIRFETDFKQLDAVQHLISYGVAQNYITVDYKLVAHNQTKKTNSPGVNVYKEIKKWPRWYSCGIKGNPVCGEEVGIFNWNEQL